MKISAKSGFPPLYLVFLENQVIKKKHCHTKCTLACVTAIWNKIFTVRGANALEGMISERSSHSFSFHSVQMSFAVFVVVITELYLKTGNPS